MDATLPTRGSPPAVEAAREPVPIRLVVAIGVAEQGEGLVPSLERGGRIEVVAEARDGPELFRLIDTVEFDAILLQVGLHASDGTDVLETLAEDRPTAPLVVRSRRTDLANADRALALGASAFVTRSAPSSEIVTAVEAAMTGGTYIGAAVASALLPREAVLARPDALRCRPLSRRQRELVESLAAGLRNKEIAHRMGLSEETVKGYLKDLYGRVGVRGRAAVVAWAARCGLIA